MSTQQQREANLRNSQLSTGPRTASGKAASSRNSLKHGVCVSDLTLGGDTETAAAIEARLTEYFDHHQPATPEERDAVEDIVLLRIRLRRALRAETGILDEARGVVYRHEVVDLPDGRAAHFFNLDRYDLEDRRAVSNRHLGAAWSTVGQTIEHLSRYEGRLAYRLERAKRDLSALQAARRSEDDTPGNVTQITQEEPPPPIVQNEPNSELTPVVATPQTPSAPPTPPLPLPAGSALPVPDLRPASTPPLAGPAPVAAPMPAGPKPAASAPPPLPPKPIAGVS